ncbi:hypothetical protein LOF24_10180 [Sinorhizobium meliloti SM11]|uniref:hypothetical protein n=1 Tax=Rhizobium meliloti TaxID=382 RepID=UPI001F0AC5BB|nr:hypothetical protein [Sinorhizobium meliloti]MDE4558430.1 hypothetical protein [Sinorhizobium meliloti SM11]
MPELETVIILVPRTGSGSLRRAIAEKYPRSTLIYRHMEADGVPAGYDRWRKVGVMRHPVARLWSLYKFLRTFDGDHDPAYIAAMRESVSMSFSDWIVDNRVPFTTPYDSAGYNRFWPQYTVRHPPPENRKSQFMYLRPDLGTEIEQFSNLAAIEERFCIKLTRHNVTRIEPLPKLTSEAHTHCHKHFAWDFRFWKGEAL